MTNKKTEAQEVTDYILEGMTQKQKDDIPLVFVEHKFEVTPKKLNVTWTKSKWSTTEIDASVFGKYMAWYTHESGIQLPYLRNRLLNMFVFNVIGRIVCFFRRVDFE